MGGGRNVLRLAISRKDVVNNRPMFFGRTHHAAYLCMKRLTEGLMSLAFLFVVLPTGSIAYADPIPAQPGQANDQKKYLLETWGIEALSIRQSAGGSMLDFRYRVLDKDKAAPLFSRKVNPYLMDQKSGAVFGVPSSPKVGALRQTRPPEVKRNYFIIFANPGRFVKKSNAVTIVIGELKIKDLIVE